MSSLEVTWAICVDVMSAFSRQLVAAPGNRQITIESRRQGMGARRVRKAWGAYAKKMLALDKAPIAGSGAHLRDGPPVARVRSDHLLLAQRD
jgi:hypothetical protein